MTKVIRNNLVGNLISYNLSPCKKYPRTDSLGATVDQSHGTLIRANVRMYGLQISRVLID